VVCLCCNLISKDKDCHCSLGGTAFTPSGSDDGGLLGWVPDGNEEVLVPINCVLRLACDFQDFNQLGIGWRILRIFKLGAIIYRPKNMFVIGEP
jgi:hypothetical protein